MTRLLTVEDIAEHTIWRQLEVGLTLSLVRRERNQSLVEELRNIWSGV